MIRTDSTRGRIALMVAHCAGMVDLVALPIWVGTLVSSYGLDPQRAGLLATLFLLGALCASVALAPFFNRLNGRLVAMTGYALSAAFFFAQTHFDDFPTMAALHALAGVSAGAALSVTHGTIARSANPHRLFAIVGMALGVFAVVFMGATPGIIAKQGGFAIFGVFAAVMLVGSIVSAFAFPVPDAVEDKRESADRAAPIPRAVWLGIVGISCMALVQAMTFSFLERVGNHKGFGLEAITGVLVALGIVSLFPAALAALLEKRLSARTVLLLGPIVQAALVNVIMSSTGFPPYAVAAAFFAPVMIFTHTFAFGLLSRLEPSGRAMAATPAMMMVGAAIGPLLGGTLVKSLGYPSLGWVALVIAGIAVFCFSRIPAAAGQREPNRV